MGNVFPQGNKKNQRKNSLHLQSLGLLVSRQEKILIRFLWDNCDDFPVAERFSLSVGPKAAFELAGTNQITLCKPIAVILT